MAEQSIPAISDAASIRKLRSVKEPIDFACVGGNPLLQVKPGAGSRARLQLALDLLGSASLTLSKFNAEAEDLPWSVSGLVEHAVTTAEALLRSELED